MARDSGISQLVEKLMIHQTGAANLLLNSIVYASRTDWWPCLYQQCHATIPSAGVLFLINSDQGTNIFVTCQGPHYVSRMEEVENNDRYVVFLA